MMNRYKQLLTYIRSAVTRNYSEKSINSILDYISTSKQVCIRKVVEFLHLSSHKCFEVALDSITTNNNDKMFPVLQMDLLQEFYETTLEALKDAKNDRLWFKTNTKVHRSAERINSYVTFTVHLSRRNEAFVSFIQLGKLYLEREEYGKLQKILRQLHQSCQVMRCFSYTYLYAQLPICLTLFAP